MIKFLVTEISVHTGNIAFRPYTLNVRTNTSSYGPRARLIRAYYELLFHVLKMGPYDDMTIVQCMTKGTCILTYKNLN